MDISFKTPSGRFNYRVCAVIIREDHLLIMRDAVAPYYYLPGGRVKLHETAENAILRELQEEINLTAQIIRPLWLCESFFTEDLSNEKYHEICLYYLVELPTEGISSFETPGNRFEWIHFRDLKSAYLYPEFIKEKIHTLPDHLEIITV